MSKDYKDRGLMKWAPFDGLKGIDKLEDEIKSERKKVSKPILGEDDITSINETLIEVLVDGSLVIISYYNQEKIEKLECSIIKIDKIEQIIYTSKGLNINLNDLLDVVKI